MKCTRCGFEMENNTVCPGCGMVHTTPAATPVNPMYTTPHIPAEYTPISAWGYVGWNLLFSIPCVGFIVLLVCALGSKNNNLKNYARSFFCVFLITLIISVIMIVILALTGALGAAAFENAASASSSYYY